ncbi:hypothetical protein GLAREA_05126 [Glarea lozoyensis ATCC 20868]|uniref:Uncharacterized protein n=1 Tax=Glarea lozoyensis (strain ATCC 20868 / MF5171) TaxID=1116229 RepID=S3EBY0_GLAL2|nr:uncharacterized protein GLAREA_05126 [Glarea lozoyensis ATCC 20868]EPE35788.1 hypothetical protein GLAREA_05126 [Glarea lozoyensis ATCC 20868]
MFRLSGRSPSDVEEVMKKSHTSSWKPALRRLISRGKAVEKEEKEEEDLKVTRLLSRNSYQALDNQRANPRLRDGRSIRVKQQEDEMPEVQSQQHRIQPLQQHPYRAPPPPRIQSQNIQPPPQQTPHQKPIRARPSSHAPTPLEADDFALLLTKKLRRASQIQEPPNFSPHILTSQPNTSPPVILTAPPLPPPTRTRIFIHPSPSPPKSKSHQNPPAKPIFPEKHQSQVPDDSTDFLEFLRRSQLDQADWLNTHRRISHGGAMPKTKGVMDDITAKRRSVAILNHTLSNDQDERAKRGSGGEGKRASKNGKRASKEGISSTGKRTGKREKEILVSMVGRVGTYIRPVNENKVVEGRKYYRDGGVREEKRRSLFGGIGA